MNILTDHSGQNSAFWARITAKRAGKCSFFSRQPWHLRDPRREEVNTREENEQRLPSKGRRESIRTFLSCKFLCWVSSSCLPGIYLWPDLPYMYKKPLGGCNAAVGITPSQALLNVLLCRKPAPQAQAVVPRLPLSHWRGYLSCPPRRSAAFLTTRSGQWERNTGDSAFLGSEGRVFIQSRGSNFFVVHLRQKQRSRVTSTPSSQRARYMSPGERVRCSHEVVWPGKIELEFAED